MKSLTLIKQKIQKKMTETQNCENCWL